MTTKQRWMLYLAAGVLTLVAVRWVDGINSAELVASPAIARAEQPERKIQSKEDQENLATPSSEVRLDRLMPRTNAPPASDPFGRRPWDEPLQRKEAVAPAPPPRPQAPPMPFTYLGKWTENGQTVVYLTRQRLNYVARVGEKIDDSYAVESIDDDRIVLNYLPLRTQQILSFASPGVSTLTATSPTATSPTATSPRPIRDPEEETD